MNNLIMNNKYLTKDQGMWNALYIYAYFRFGCYWSVNSVIGMLGNMYRESTWNFGLGERGGSGYGIVQWTPKSKYTSWLSKNGLTDTPENQCYRIQYEWIHNIQWINIIKMSFHDYTKSNIDYKRLCYIFMRNYERPGIFGLQERYNACDWIAEKIRIAYPNDEIIDTTPPNIDNTDNIGYNNDGTNYTNKNVIKSMNIIKKYIATQK